MILDRPSALLRVAHDVHALGNAEHEALRVGGARREAREADPGRLSEGIDEPERVGQSRRVEGDLDALKAAGGLPGG